MNRKEYYEVQTSVDGKLWIRSYPSYATVEEAKGSRV